MYQPHIIEVDPQRIKFNKQNPRKHGGAEYESLKQSIQEMGIIQPPLVRHTTGIFYEVIDGEGRVSVAQDLGLSTIQVVNLGDITEDEALEKLVVSNVVRQFDFFATCKGMAIMHRKGKTAEQISRELGIPYPGMAIRDIAIGYFPAKIIETILDSIGKDEFKARVWSNHTMIYEVLPLRIQINGGPANQPNLDGVYDYSEVQRAIEQVIAGKISDGVEMRAYVADRRRELFEERFSKELREQLDAEIEQAKQKLEEAKALDIKNAEEGAKQRYQAQIDVLEVQKKETEKKYEALQAKIARGGDPETLKKELEGERKKTEEASKKVQEQMQELIRQGQERQRQEREQELKEMRAQIDKEMQRQREQFASEQAAAKAREEKAQAEARANLEAYYKDKDTKRQLKAEAGYRQLIASASQHLAESQQSILTLTSQDMLRGVEWLSQEELGSLLFAMRAARNTLDEAEQAIQERMGVVSSSEMVIDEQVTERSLMNHHG